MCIRDRDYIIHAASNTHPIDYSLDPIGTISSNVIGTNNLLEYGVKHNCNRFVFLSSVEIYGENRGDIEKFDEKDVYKRQYIFGRKPAWNRFVH